MKDYPEQSRAWDIAEAIVLVSACVIGAVASVYFAAYFISNIIGG